MYYVYKWKLCGAARVDCRDNTVAFTIATTQQRDNTTTRQNSGDKLKYEHSHNLSSGVKMEFRDKIYYQCNTPRDNLLSLKCARLSHQVSRVPSSTRKPEMSGLDILYRLWWTICIYLVCGEPISPTWLITAQASHY